MKHDGGRRILLAALVVCLGLLVFLFARRSVDAQMQIERRHPRVNGDLYMTVDGDGVATIHGAGKLYDSDVRAMLNSVGLHEDTVEDIIVGDRVTEICYNTFDGYDRLKSLKLGDRVARVAPGSLKNCPALEYLWFPEKLEDVGLDFLYMCKSCIIVTGGKASGLPELANVRTKKRILAGVDSHEAMLAAVDDEALPAGVAKWWRQ